MLRALAVAVAAILGAGCGERTDGPGPTPSRGRPESTKPVREAGRTVFHAHPSVKFDADKENAVWCASFPLAWDSLGRDVLKGPVDLGPPAPADLVKALNGDPFPQAALDPSSYVAMAGTKSSGILDRIAKEGREKFGRALPQMPVFLERPDDILAYAFLRKDLPFEHPFETVPAGVRFRGAGEPVPAFGIAAWESKIGIRDVLRQASVVWRSPLKDGERYDPETESFILELVPKGGKDRILLARITPEPTLEGTWKRVAAAVGEGKREGLHEGAHLAVPRIHFDLEHRYAEFQGAPVRNKGAFEGWVVTDAMQSVLFRLDEAGALLESEAAIKAVGAAVESRPQRFVFDHPFLIALRQDGAERPYFLLWIANTDLMPK